MTLDLQPTLKGSRVSLRPLRTEDFEALFAVASDPLIWEQHPKKTRYQRDVFEKFFKDAMDSRGALLVTDTATGKVIGSSRYYDFKPEKKEIVIGYTFLARSHWGYTYNKEMKKLMLEHAFIAVDTVFFQIGENNVRSRRSIERIGAICVGADSNPKDPMDSWVIYRLQR